MRIRLAHTFLLAGGLALALSGVTACGKEDSSSSPSSTASTSAKGDAVRAAPRTIAAGKGSGKADGQFPRTVKHFKGETTVSAQPQRVVAVSTGQSDALLTLGIAPVGVGSPDGTETVPQYLKDAFPDKASELQKTVSIGSRTEPSVEEIAKLKPDLILVNKAGKGDSAALYKSLSAIAPTVVTEGTGVNWKSDFLLLADALGKRDAAQQRLDAFHASAKALAGKVTPKQTVSFLNQSGQRTRVYGVSSFAGSIAEDAGVARPAAQSFKGKTSRDISSEELDKADAAWIFYGVKGGKNSKLESLPLWKTLTAVKNEHAVAVDNDPFYLNAGPTAANHVLSTLSKRLVG